MKQDERAPFVQALQRAREAAYAPGEYVEQESFMRAGRSGRWRGGPASGPGSPCSTCAAESRGRDGSSRVSWAAAISGVDSSASAIDIARERAARPPLSLRGRAGPAAPCRHVRRGAPARDPARVSGQGDAAAGDRRGARPAGGSPSRWRRARPDRVGAGAHAGRRHGLAHAARGAARAARAGRADRPLAGRLQPVPPRHGGFVDRRVRRRRDRHRRADRTPGAGRAAGRPPALERLAGDRPRPQDRVRGGEATKSDRSSLRIKQISCCPR